MSTPASQTGSPIEGLLNLAAGEPTVLEPYRPLFESLDWQLGHVAYAQEGHKAFLDGDVPYLVTNDGLYAERAASLLFTSLEERTTIPEQIRVLEFGAGSCLFARLFDRAFQRLCEEHSKDYAGRLLYIVADRYEAMLENAERAGVLPENGRVVTALGDALSGELVLRSKTALLPARFDAIVLNYVLDCLPAAIVRRKSDNSIEQLYAQTELVQEPGQKRESFTREELIELYPSFTVRCRYQPVTSNELPFLDEVFPALEPERPMIHSFGAVLCLDRLFERLDDGGFILVGDYPDRASVKRVPGRPSIPYEHFGGYTAIALNFDQMENHFSSKPQAAWVKPGADDNLIVRMLGRNIDPKTISWFQIGLSGETIKQFRAPQELARDYRKNGRKRAALRSFLDAIRLQPNNWYAIAEAAMFVQSDLEKPEIAGRLSQLGLELNPISLELWNTLGDSLLSLGRIDQAHQVYQRALEFSPSHAYTKYNTIFTLTRKGQFAEALKMIAEVLVADKAGEFTGQLLQRQSEIIQTLKQRYQQGHQRLMDRMVVEES